MSISAANPAGLPHVSLCTVDLANERAPRCNGGGELHPSCTGHANSERALTVVAFRSQRADEELCSEECLPFRIPPLFGHRFGAFHAPCGSSLFCFGCAALRVTVSLQILFAKSAEKISPEPP